MAYSAFSDMSFPEMLERLNKYLSPDDVKLVEKAYHFAEDAHQGQQRMSGEPYFYHPMHVAGILVELMLDAPSIVAGFLHDTVEDVVGISVEIIEKNFGKEIADLVDGVTKIGRLDFADREDQKAESLRKMILAMGKDIRVILVKLADRLHNMRTLAYQPADRQVAIARETLDIYAPIAHRLGVYRIKQEIEDLALRYIDAEGYRDVANKVGQKRIEREAQIKAIIETLTEKIKEIGINSFEIAGRPKHLYSIYRKMVMQNKSFDQIYDLIAIRVLVNSVQDCYAVLGVAHTIWIQMPGRFKDYISMPKSNMYQSLHTTLIGGRTIPSPFEVQIRTYEMNKVAEFGIAAHWNYKEGASDKKDDKKFYWLRQILDWQSEARDSKEFYNGLKTELYADEIFVFTPKGDILNLQRGATPLDFAYRIHSQVGNACTGAKINGKMVPLATELQNGDRIEVLTSSQSKGPSLDWLNVVKTQQAKAKIRQYFKRELKSENIQLGHDILENEAKRRGAKLGDLLKAEFLNPLLERYSLADLDSLFSIVGCRGITSIQVISKLQEEQRRVQELIQKKNPPPVTAPKPLTQQKAVQGVYVEGQSGMQVRFARCCNPLPGDEIIGFISRGRGVAVHKVDCVNMINAEKERLINASWSDEKKGNFSAFIKVIIHDKPTILGEIMALIESAGVQVSSTKIDRESPNKKGLVTLHYRVEVSGADQLKQLITRLLQRVDVVEAYRSAQ